ncbi:MAG: 1,4-dihydroxy-2-naphthoate polyprenyltransferase [Ilumatobacteraceae bacterium]|nr:1,4-dihydroxy-2-naphthoate polyprenyltransferase [Acidimicrobiales bacterium]MCB9394134.1 1,4-dihydroxy-2-naphthoate polyprenyltransferase [Acidimicrobiaceae bacterium]
MNGSSPTTAPSGPRPSLATWVAGARPRTLPAAVVPVALGAVVGMGEHGARWWTVPFALFVSLALQVGVNYANDYSDGVRGTDEVRVGPIRLVASGAATPGAVKRAAFAAFGAAALAGAVLAATTSWWLIAVGAASVLAGWFYTGGSHPYGYLGLGEVFVFVFFGLVATVGTTFVVLERLPSLAWVLGCVAGCLSCALLVVNNLRDIPTDRDVGKRTLAVRLGDRHTRWFYVSLLATAFVLVAVAAVIGPIGALAGLVAVAATVSPVRTVLGGAVGRGLIPVLGATGRVQLLVGLLVTLGVALTA